MRPVLRGLITYTDLKRCELDLQDIVLMNTAIDCEEENKARIADEVNRGQ